MDKQKQIEEMARDICNMCRDMYGVCDNKEELCPAIKAEMEYLYNAGYRKIPENAVVLTREEYDKIVSGTWVLDSCIYRQARKETAEKFAERVKMAFYYEFDELIPSIMADKIDEIAKEITEGKNG